MVRRKRRGCREVFERRESFIMEIKVVVRQGWKSWRWRQKCFEGAGTDAGTHLGAEVVVAMLVEWPIRKQWRGPRGLEGQRERKMLWSKRASGRGLSSSLSLSRGDEPCKLGKALDPGERRERRRASNREGKKRRGVIAESAECMCSGERRTRNAKL